MASYSGLEFVHALNQGGPEVVHGYYEANSQSFHAGALVYLNSGAVTARGDNAGALGVIGVALKDATNVTSGNIEIPFILIRPGDVFKIKIKSTATNNTLTTTECFTDYDISVDSGHTTLDLDDAIGICIPLKPLENGTYALVTFDPSYLQGFKSAVTLS